MNKINQKRENEKSAYSSYEDFLKSLDMQAEIDFIKPIYVKIFISTLVCVLINVLLWKLKLFVVDVKFIAIKKNIEAKLKK